MQVHRAFLLTSLALAAPLGTAMGLGLLATWLGHPTGLAWTTLVLAHSQIQVFGFVSLFTMGVALLMWPKVLSVELRGKDLALLSLLSMLAGTGLAIAGQSTTGATLQGLSGAAFLSVLWRTRRAATTRRPISSEQSLYLISGTCWLIISPLLTVKQPTLGLESTLWGFAGLYVAGLGLRLHPGILGIKGIRQSLLLPSVVFWNLGLGLRVAGLRPWWVASLALGVGLFLTALRPLRASRIPPGGMPWLRPYVRLAYLWLALAVILQTACELERPWLASAARHTLATGFLVTMMVGMGLRMLLAFEGRRLRWSAGPWAVLGCLFLGTILRVSGQAWALLKLTAVGGGLQALAIWAFVLLMLSATRVPMPAPVSVSRPEPAAPNS